jgi:hypothetical protein
LLSATVLAFIDTARNLIRPRNESHLSFPSSACNHRWMNHGRRALCTLLSLSLLVGATPALSNSADDLLALCSVDTLPKDIRNSLSRNFSAWKIQEPQDLSARARVRWGEERPLACPGIAAGRFQDPKDGSYALLLVPTNRASNAFKLLIYTQQAGQQYYGFKAVAQGDADGNEIFIATVPTVRFFEATSKWVAHSRVSEAVMMVDSANTQSYLYVWSDLAYEREQVNYR